MNDLQNDRLLRALRRQPVDKTPVWIMRQAGRYLPEYRALRTKAGDFMQLCKTPELAGMATLQPLARYDLDAAILFSDILTIPDAMGLGLSFTPGDGPCFAKTIRTNSDLKQLGIPDPEVDLRYVMDAIRLIKSELQQTVPLIGFAGSPWTLATYMVEGKPSKDFRSIKAMLYADPQLLHGLLTTLTQSVVLYLQAQIKAGVDAIMIFDTWGGVLTPRDYQDFSLHYMQTIVQELKKVSPVPIILFTKGGGAWLEKIANTACDAIGVDWTLSLAGARQRVGDKVALQGNMDPAVLYATPERIQIEVQEILASYGSGSGHIFNLGHGIMQEVPVDNVKVMVDAVHEFSAAYHDVQG